MKPRHWWYGLAGVCLAAGLIFLLRSPLMIDDNRPRISRPQTVAGSGATRAVPAPPAASEDTAPDQVPPPHEISSEPPLGFAPPPDSEPLPPPEEMDALLKSGSGENP